MAKTPSQPVQSDLPAAVLVSAMRNEATFLLEWVAYHRVIGFSKIVVCANPSTDGTDALLAALAKAGAITYLPTQPRPDQSPLEAAAAAFEATVGYRDGAWYAWLDADEFLNVQCGARKVQDLIAALGPAQGIMLNWRLFGTSGRQSFPGRFISPDFVRASVPGFVANLETKPFFRKSAEISGFAKIGQERPALAKGHMLAAGDFLGGNGQPLLATEARNHAWLAGQPLGRSNRAARREAGAALAQINHYAVRTPDHYRLKQMRGRGFLKAGGKTGRLRYDATYFSRFDRNEAEDRSILHWQDAVGAEISRLLATPAIARAQGEADALIAAELRRLDPVHAGAAAVPVMHLPLVNADPEPQAQAEGQDAVVLTFGTEEAALVTANYTRGRRILEYGSGGSTVLAARAGCHVVTVESGKGWAKKLAAELATISDLARVHYVDIGPTGPWGFPHNGNEHARFHHYALSVWDRPDLGEPDLVLIDGRFRAACLAAVLLRAKRPTTVLFDDYAKRGYYHRVEQLARKEEMIGRMARFTVTPGPIPPDMLTEVTGWFTDPR